jgi:hypothetical protein
MRVTSRIPSLVSAVTVLSAVGAPLAAQMPDTDIYLANLHIAGDSVHVGEPRNLTDRPGYDNQPWFLRGDNALLFNADMGGQTDVFRYDLETGAQTRLTDTPENEFSPSLTADGSEMLIVRWEADMSDGHLWRYSPAGEPLGVHAADVPRVGYYGAANDGIIVAFVNDSARSLVVADARTGKRVRLGDGLGGSPPQVIPGEDAVSFVQADSAGDMWIMRLDLASHAIAPIARTVEGSASYAWLGDGVLLMPGGNALYALRAGAPNAVWREVARFDGISAISRVAVNRAGDMLALVVGQ